MTESDVEMLEDTPVTETLSQPIQPCPVSTTPLPQTINNVHPSQFINPSQYKYTPFLQGDLMGTPRVFGPKNPDISPKTFLKAIKRGWAFNPSFFINDDIKIAFAATRLSGPAEIWLSVLEDRDDPCFDSWDLSNDRLVLI